MGYCAGIAAPGDGLTSAAGRKCRELGVRMTCTERWLEKAVSAVSMSGSLTVATEPVHARRSFFLVLLVQGSPVFAKNGSTGMGCCVVGESIAEVKI